MNVTLRQLRGFVAVAAAEGFTGAAKRLHITQSALSLLIKDLETELGVRLFDRTTRSTSLSDVGREVLPLFDGVLKDLDRAVSSIADLRDLKRGIARIAAPQIMSLTMLPSMLASYRTRFPGVQVRLVECLMEQIEARLTGGEIDFAVGPERSMGSDIDITPLKTEPVMLVCQSGHPLAHADEVRWSDVLKHPFIALRGEYGAQIDRDLRAFSKKLTMRPAEEVTYITTALSMVSGGLGVTACARDVLPLVRSYGLTMVPVAKPHVVREFSVYMRRGRTLSPSAQSLLDWTLRSAQGTA